MAKTSSVEKNNRRRKLVDQYAAKRKALKEIVMDQSKPMDERFRAQLKLSALPRNSAKIRIRNRCEVTGRPRAFYRKLKVSRIALRDLGNTGQIPGLVKSSWYGGQEMSLSDPLGDMLTRIRNAYGRKKSSVSTPASRLRARVLDVLKSEGYIRDYSQTDFDNGKSEIEIELKYFDGNPVVREISRVSKPGRRVYVSAKSIPQVANGLGIAILSTPKGVMADHEAREQNVGGEVLCQIF